MAQIYPVRTPEMDGTDRILWVAESRGAIIGTGNTEAEAANAAYESLIRCIDMAQRHHLPNRYVNTLLKESEVFRVPGISKPPPR